ncbi:hypothetical protein DFH07DRAFT_1057426 [Mycena maculata]|uniref:DUF7923 domain-containing protein n=1 Tax=Mycena maculata TaxID=230809 RepID=A0AAD7JVN5_9AGAR|nr:hypothetical protein DFH07DRAFT_1057426 [Mycena maculata]
MEPSSSNGNLDVRSPQHPLELCLDNLKGDMCPSDEVTSALRNETSYKETIERLEAELSSLNNQDKGDRVVILADGCDAIFSTQLIGEGEKGGQAAAQLLSDSTSQHLTANYGPRPFKLWVYVFFNKHGLIDVFRNVELTPLISKIEDFIIGFNQTAERFLMVDVGSKENAPHNN